MICFEAMQSAKISCYRFSTKEQNIKILVNTQSCRKPVLSEAHFRFFFFLWKRLYWQNWEYSIPNFAQHVFFVFLKKGTNGKEIQNYCNEFKSTLTQEPSIHFNFHDAASLEFDLCQNGCEVRCMNYNNVGIPSPLCMVAGAMKLKTMQCCNSYTVQKEH